MLSRPIVASDNGAANIKEFGGRPDGATDILAPLNAAKAAGVKTIIIDEGSSFYRLSNTFNFPSGLTLKAGIGRPTITMDNAAVSRMFVFSAVSDSHIDGFLIDGNSSVTPTDALIVISGGATRCSVARNKVINAPSAPTGTIVISGSTTSLNEIAENEIIDAEATAIGVSGGSENYIGRNRVQGNGGFGIWIGAGANKNVIEGNRSTLSALEVVALTYDAFENRIIGNHCEGSGDNGISISGYRNVCMGNVCARNAKAGIGVWGSQNAIVGNNCVNNNLLDTNFWSGVWVGAMFGGTGQNNTISGNNFDDNQSVPTQYNCVRIDSTGYIDWAAGQSISVADYRVNGLNIYRASSTGTTALAAPTHTTGTVADGGGVQWLYQNSFKSLATVRNNSVFGNSPGLTKSGTAFDDPNRWIANSLVSHGTINISFNPTYGLHLANLPDYADDAAAALAGLSVGQVYLNSGAVRIRVV